MKALLKKWIMWVIEGFIDRFLGIKKENDGEETSEASGAMAQGNGEIDGKEGWGTTGADRSDSTMP